MALMKQLRKSVLDRFHLVEIATRVPSYFLETLPQRNWSHLISRGGASRWPIPPVGWLSVEEPAADRVDNCRVRFNL
jgi:hypothetical protein